MVDDIDIHRSALLLIDQHGDKASIHAAMKADELSEKGDLDGAAAWRRILDAIKQMQNKTPAGTVH